MKKLIIASVLGLATLSSCNKFLDRQPLDSYSSETFFKSDAEVELGTIGLYGAVTWVNPNNNPLHFVIDAATDHALRRNGNAEDLIAMGDAGPFLVNNSITTNAWASAFNLVARSNDFLAGIEKNKSTLSPRVYNRALAEGLTLRAWSYYHLIAWFGDPVFYTKPLLPSEFVALKRTPTAEAVAALYKDLDAAAAAFDAAAVTSVAQGRVDKGVALGIKAKLAMLVKDYRTAATATKAIIDSRTYSLNPVFQNLFYLNGQRANAGKELMFVQTYPTDVQAPENWMTWVTVPRQVSGSQSSHFPSQALVDLFEGKDGKRIDQSTVYNPADPKANRDNRLRWTVVMPGDTITYAINTGLTKERIIFTIYQNQRVRWNYTTNKFDVTAGGNNDWVGATAAGIQWQVSATGSIGGLGYVWRKFVDSTQMHQLTKTGLPLMRYADILLLYAESKIELNEIDGTVLDAINLVRRRAGQPDAVAASQAEMRTLIRRERGVELAGEGLRWIDVKRWAINDKAMVGPVVGASKDGIVVPATPTFDANNVPDYSSSINDRINNRRQIRAAGASRFLLWPIPQNEIDLNPNITQNPGW